MSKNTQDTKEIADATGQAGTASRDGKEREPQEPREPRREEATRKKAAALPDAHTEAHQEKGGEEPAAPQAGAGGRSLPDSLHNLWRNALNAFHSIRWSYAAIALALSVTLWYTVTVRDKVESWVDVQVVFKGTPEGLVIRDGLINKLAVRVRAARGLSRSLTGRSASVAIDLSGIAKGVNTILIKPDMLPFNSAYEIVEISPPSIRIEADTVASRDSSLDVRFEGALSGDLFVKSLHANPPQVTLRGPEGILASMGSVRLTVPLNKDLRVGTSIVPIPLILPAGVTAEPAQVNAELEIGVKTRQVRLTRDVAPAAYKDGRQVTVAPARVTIVANIPEEKSRDAGELASVTASVSLPPDMGNEPLTLPVDVTLPEYSSLVSVTPGEVTVTPARRP